MGGPFLANLNSLGTSAAVAVAWGVPCMKVVNAPAKIERVALESNAGSVVANLGCRGEANSQKQQCFAGTPQG